MKHTKGPWEVTHFDATPGIYYIDQCGEHGAPGLVEVRRGNGQSDEMNKANAELIALAPEMLEAILTFDRFRNTPIVDDDFPRMRDCAYFLLDSIIKKLGAK